MNRITNSVIELPPLLVAEPISYLPATAAALALLAVAGLLFLLGLARLRQGYRRNRYRRAARAAVRQLAGQVAAGDCSRSEAAAALNQLLKRTALAATGERQQVAMLAGAAWWSWLDSSLPSPAEPSFGAVGELWQQQLWQPERGEPSAAQWRSWLVLAEHWIANHTLATADKKQ